MTLALVMIFEVSVAMAIGFVLGRIWQIRCDLEQQRAVGFTAPTIPPAPASQNSPQSAASPPIFAQVHARNAKTTATLVSSDSNAT